MTLNIIEFPVLDILSVNSDNAAMETQFIISQNKVFGDIMVLASPPRPPRPPVDPNDVNTLNSKNIQPISFKFYMRVDTPRGTLLLKFDTLRPNDTHIPQIFKLQYLHK